MNEPNPLWLIAAFPLFFVGLWALISLLLSVLSGWRSLAESYPAVSIVDGQLLRARSARIGFTNYNGCLHFTAGAMHLHMVPIKIFRLGHFPLSVPWSDIAATERRGLIFRQVELRFSRVPRVRFLVSKKTAAVLAEASRGQLSIAPSGV